MARREKLTLGVLLLAVLLVYANSFSNGFHFDDFHAVTDNPALRSLSNIPRIFRDASAFSVLPANQTYRPVVTASLALDYAIGHGYRAFAFHLSTMLWFLALVLAVYGLASFVFRATLPDRVTNWLALGVAAWFGLHPVMAETVNYVIQRGDLYCTLGCVAALWMYAAKARARRYGLYLIPFVLAMLSKPPAAVFPALLFLLIFFFLERDASPMQRWRNNFVAVVPATAVDGVLLRLQSTMTPKTFAPSTLPAGAYRLIQPYVWLRYMGELFLPTHLNVDTDLRPAAHIDAHVLAGLVFAIVLVITASFAAQRRRLYPIAFGLFWFLFTQLPTSMYALSEVENDHRMFFSFPGLMIAVVWAAYLLYERIVAKISGPRRVRAARAATVLGILCLCGYAYGAHERNRVWRDEGGLWADDVAKSPTNGRGLMNYGLVRMAAGDAAGARDLFQRASRYTPNYATLEINQGIADGLLADAGRPELAVDAERHFRRAVSLAPGDDAAYAYYGRWLMNHGRTGEAIAELQHAVSLNGQRPLQRDLLLQAYLMVGDETNAESLARMTLTQDPTNESASALLRGGRSAQHLRAAALINQSLNSYRAKRFHDSIEEAQAALQFEPQSAEAWNNIGAAFGALHQWPKAINAEQTALRLDPGLAIAGNNLRWFQSQQKLEEASGSVQVQAGMSAAAYVDESLALNREGRYEESLRAAENAARLNPQFAEAWNNIAANDEALQRWDEAITAAQRALSLRPDFQLAKNNLAWSQQQKALHLHQH